MFLEDYFSKYIEDEDDLEHFGEWAFGKDFNIYDHSLKFMKAWNLRHCHNLQIKTQNHIENDVPKMVDLWRKIFT